MGTEKGERAMKNPTAAERVSDCELVVTRTVNAPARIVFEAWTNPDLFRQWWTPRSFGLTILSCEMDVRVGGGYRLTIAHPRTGLPMAFFGRYLEVMPAARLVWTNDDAGEDGAVTTVTFEEVGGGTLVVLRDLYPSKKALDEAIASGSTSGFGEQFAQLEEFLAAMGAAPL